MTAHADLAEVRAALAPVAKATSGPWRTFGRWPNLAVVSGSDRPRIVASLASASDAVDDTPKDAAAIVALRNAAPAISAAVEELTAARAEIAALRRQVCRLTSGDEIEGDRLCQHHGADVAALALLADERAAHAETSRDLDALLTALGAQVTPGGQTLDACHARRVADGMRRARDLVAARKVPADVEAAIRAAIDGAVSSGEARALGHASLLTGEPFYTEPRLRAAIAKAIADAEERGRTDGTSAPHDVEVAISDLVAASRDLEVYAEGKVTAKRTRSAERSFGRARTALRAAIAAEIERARAEVRGEAKAAPATVGGLLATAPVGSVVEHERDGDGRFAQIKTAPSGEFWKRRAWAAGSWWSWCDVSVIDVNVVTRPARLIPASEADADPASRGPIDRPPVCSTCNDTHAMTIGDRTVMCTRCPTPCQSCRAGGNGPFCGSTPCTCECHAKIGGGS